VRSQKARVQGRVILLELVHSPLRRAVLLLLQGGEQLLLQLREGIIIGRLVATEILAGVALRGPLVRGVVGHVGGGGGGGGEVGLVMCYARGFELLGWW
jgi:hypothetical protein